MDKIRKSINIPFIILLLIQALPTKRDLEVSLPLTSFAIILQIYYYIIYYNSESDIKKRTLKDVLTILFCFLIIWELATAKFDILDKVLYPSPSSIIILLIKEFPEFIKGAISSFQILIIGYITALSLAIPLALVAGYNNRVYNAISPYTRVLGPIPPIVFIPYVIGIMPTFKMASIFVIFVGVFWPVFRLTLHGVLNIDKKIIQSARMLNVNNKTMIFKIVLPAILPSVLSGSSMGLSSSFGILTAAEMIGARSGLGFYVKYFSDFLNYPKVIVGIIYIGIAISLVNSLFKKIEEYFLRWQQ
ncbi:ABC transporter permease subunit [Tissierella sp.]|uniref:ABC transporter permease n=1 Tax=Tissierella sp. TaxID=41274 RepID=UPI0028AC30E7|nr:ABC transporter permease subunit [Tissierella sp.]